MFPLGEDRVSVAVADGIVSIGWGKVGRDLLSEYLDRRAFSRLVHDTYHSGDADRIRSGNAAGQLWRFLREMRPGDLVLATHWGRLHVAKVIGPPTHDPSTSAEHWAYQRPVDWLTGSDGVLRDSASDTLRRRMRSRMTCIDISDLEADVRRLVTDH